MKCNLFIMVAVVSKLVIKLLCCLIMCFQLSNCLEGECMGEGDMGKQGGANQCKRDVDGVKHVAIVSGCDSHLSLTIPIASTLINVQQGSI